jgi:hypothetical protein
MRSYLSLKSLVCGNFLTLCLGTGGSLKSPFWTTTVRRALQSGWRKHGAHHH